MLEEMERQKKEQEAEEKRKKVKYYVCVNWWETDDVVTLKNLFSGPAWEVNANNNILPLMC